MRIGVPRERKTLEQRVAITPEGAKQLVVRGHSVLIETGAGVGSSFTDDDYRATGCAIVGTLAEVWTQAELLVKVKEPHDSEFEFFRSDLVLFDYLHLASLPEVAKALLAKNVTAFAYETLKTAEWRASSRSSTGHTIYYHRMAVGEFCWVGPLRRSQRRSLLSAPVSLERPRARTP
jgi:alanine dehydrogenase